MERKKCHIAINGLYGNTTETDNYYPVMPYYLSILFNKFNNYLI